MVISENVLLALIGLAGVLFGILRTMSASRAKTAQLKAEGQLAEAKAQAEKVIAEAEKIKAEADRTRGDSAVLTQITTSLQQQITINAQDAIAQTEMRKSIEANYRVLADTQRDVGQMLLTEIQTGRRRIIEAVEGIPAAVQKSVNEDTAAFAKVMATEIAISISEEFRRHKVEEKMHPFPDADDPGWKEEVLYPLVEGVTIRKEPYHWDSMLLEKPCARIAPEGEKMLVIADREPGWVIVDKTLNGQRCWGWVWGREVRVGVPEMTAAPA